MGGKSEKAPTPYQPAGQAQADQNYQQLVQNNMPWATALPGQVIPGMNQAAQNVVNNPYAGGAQQGANMVSQMAFGGGQPGYASPRVQPSNSGTYFTPGGVAPNGIDPATMGSKMAGDFAGTSPVETMGSHDPAAGYPPMGGAPQPGGAPMPGGGGVVGGMMNSSNALHGLGDIASAMAPMAGQESLASGRAAYDRGGSMSDYLMSLVPGAVSGGVSNANALWGQTQAAIPGMTGGMTEAQTLLNNGFDPQSGLYDREYQKMMDQQNAINSMYGVSGSPYGAGVAGDASRNFNLDWQNNQLSRQIAALGAYGQQQGQVTNNLTSLLGTGAQGYDALMNGATSRGSNLVNSASGVFNSGVSSYNTAMNGAVDRFGNMVNTAGNAYGQASGQGVDALNTLTTASQLPNQTYLQQQQAAMAALAALSAGAGSAMNPTQPLVGNEGNYLNIGQQATAGAQNAVQINNAAKAAETQALMQGIGMIASVAMAPMTGGASLFGMAGAAGGKG